MNHKSFYNQIKKPSFKQLQDQKLKLLNQRSSKGVYISDLIFDHDPQTAHMAISPFKVLKLKKEDISNKIQRMQFIKA